MVDVGVKSKIMNKCLKGRKEGPKTSKNVSILLLLLLRSQSHAQTSSPVLTRKSAVRRRDAVGPQSFSFRSTGYGPVSCLRLLCDGQD